MNKISLFSVSFFLLFLILIISCNMPPDPFKKPSNSKTRLFLVENENTMDFGSEIKIGVSVFLAEHIEALHVYTRNNGLDSIHFYNAKAVDDTVYFNHKFTVEGKDTIFVTGILKDKNYTNKTDTLPVFILPAPDSIYFDSIADPVYTVTENLDTLVFMASARSEKTLDFSVKSDPKIDSGLLELIQTKDTARVIIRTDEPGKYAITLYAKRDTLIDSASVNVTVYEPLVFQNVTMSDTLPPGEKDTVIFTVSKKRDDTLSIELLNRNDFDKQEITVLTDTPDSLVFVFKPEKNGLYEFSMRISNRHIENRIDYSVVVITETSLWNTKEETFSASEGEEITVDLRTFLNVHIPDSVVFSSDLGIVEDTVWKWTPPWGSDTTRTAVISALINNDTCKLTVDISVTESDTTGPSITLVDSSMNDTIIGSSQISMAATVIDSGAGISSVKLVYNAKTLELASAGDNIYIGFVRELENGKKTELKIIAQDSSMRKNTTEHVFYITYDSTLGDNVPPVINQISGPVSGSRITDGQIKLSFSVTDDSDIDSVYWFLDTNYMGILTKEDSIYALSGTLDKYESNEVKIFAVDKSVNGNLDSLELLFDYNTTITDMEIVSPENEAAGVNTKDITFTWSGAKDNDGDTVFIELHYGISDNNLNGKITGTNCSTLVLSEELDSYTDYYWRVIAYSKVYPDTVKSPVYSFKTEAEPPVITSQPEKNIDLDIGEKIVLKVSAMGKPAPSYRWIKDGKVKKDGKKDSLVIDYAALGDSGGYVVEAYNDEGDTVKSDEINLRIIYPVKIAAGGNHSMILKNDGSLWACGSDSLGQLGSSTTDNENTPVEIMKDVANIAAGYSHSLILKNDCTLWACGDNYYGQLGNANNDNENTPVEIMNDVTNINAGAYQSLIIKPDGSLWACGLNSSGQLGNKSYDNINHPDSIMNDVANIATGGLHSLILKENGSLWACGWNKYGQLGDKLNEYVNDPDSIMDDIANINAGAYHSLIIKTDGSLWACGRNEYGQLGDGTNEDKNTPVEIMKNVANIAAGFEHSLLLKNDGTLWACGSNGYGQLGDGTNKNKSTPVEIMKNVANIAAGKNHSLILKNDGTLWACGHNYSGKLGDSTTENRNVPVRIIPKTAEQQE